MAEYRVVYLCSNSELGMPEITALPGKMVEVLSTVSFTEPDGAFKHAAEFTEGRKPRVFMEVMPGDVWGDVQK